MSQPTPALTPRRRNWAILYGTLLMVVAILAYYPGLYALKFPGLLPWINLALPAIGVIFFIVALKRAFGQPAMYRGKILGSILGTLSFLLLAGSVFGHLHAKDLPTSTGAPQIGQKAPDFTLADTSGKQISLSEMLVTPIDASAGKPPKAVLLVFYRGWW